MERVFFEEPVYIEEGKKDFLSTCFYMLAMVQEYGEEQHDKFGRFPHSLSFQKHFKCTEHALVTQYFHEVLKASTVFSKELSASDAASRVFLTHDVDSIYETSGLNAKQLLKGMKPLAASKALFSSKVSKAEQSELREMSSLEKDKGWSSSFFWLTTRETFDGVAHGDYDLTDPHIKSLLSDLAGQGHQNGLHKSFASSSFDQELSLVPGGQAISRNHYLRFSLPEHFDQLEASKVQLDLSVGFAEEIGFRNCYGKVYHPWNLRERKAYGFKILPLQIMDATFIHYHGLKGEEAFEQIRSFLQRNKVESDLCILWHNLYFGSLRFADFKTTYLRVLEFLDIEGFEKGNIQDLLQE